MARKGTGFRYKHEFHGAAFDEADFTLIVDGESRSLPRSPAQTLAALLRRPNELLGVNDLPFALSAGTLHNNISAIRTALGKPLSDRIVNQKGVGYQFAGEVHTVVSGRGGAAALKLAVGDAVPQRPTYTLRRRLGAGDETDVWLARRDADGDERVFKFVADGHGLGRLRREHALWRVADAILGPDAPIAAGAALQDQAPPFFIESEYCGPDLRTWARESDRLAQTPAAQRLRLATALARAVATVRRGANVLHGAVRPSNVVVDAAAGDPTVRLIDFAQGDLDDRSDIGRLNIPTDGLDVRVTETPDVGDGRSIYLAPEVAQGGAFQPASDAYALGVTVYQILAGDIDRPMTSHWQDDVANPLLVEDLEAVTDPDPDRRPTVEQFLERLETAEQRRIDRAAVRQAEDQQRASEKQHRQRRRLLLAVAATALVAVATSTLAVRANVASARADLQSRRAIATSDFLNEVLRTADPRTPGVSTDTPVKDALLRAIDKADAQFEADPDFGVSILRMANDIVAGSSDFATQIDLVERTLSLLQARQDDGHPDVLLERYKLALIYANAGRFEESDAEIRAADALLGDKSDRSATLRLQAALAKARNASLRQRYAEAAPYYAQANAAYAQTDPPDPYYLYGINMGYGEALSRLGRRDEAAQILKALAEPAPDVAAATPQWRIATAKILYGQTLHFIGRNADAERVLSEAIEALGEIYGAESFLYAQAVNSLAEVRLETGEYALARKGFEIAADTICTLYGADFAYCLFVRMNGAAGAICDGAVDVGLASLEADRAKVARLHPTAREPLPYYDFYRAQGLLERGRTQEARRLVEALDVEALKAFHPNRLWPHRLAFVRAWVAAATQPTTEAAKLMSDALVKMERDGASPAEMRRLRRAAARVAASNP